MNARWAVICAMWVASAASAQTAPAGKTGDDDLDVTMRVIVDPEATAPGEIVNRIPLPKPGTPASGTAPEPGKANKNDKADQPKPKESGPKPQGPAAPAAPARDSGRDFGQQTAEQARQRSEENRRNEKPDKPDKPPKPPKPEPPRGRPQG
jgi:hypothetical protein